MSKNNKIEWCEFSETSIRAITESDAFINIYEGAVRSSKTITSILIWIDFVMTSPHSEFLMTGKTIDTLYRNVIGGNFGILNILGGKKVQFKKSAQGGARLVFKTPKGDKICYCVGANDKRSEGNIRGMTIGGWYADEVTLYPNDFVKQALNRMSLSGARAFWTTNPDSPFHPIKTDYIDKAEENGYRVFHFTLDDNLSLTEEYKENIKRAYSGLWYKRMILGEWVMADGVIYDMFNPETMVVTSNEVPPIKKYWVGCDYGTSNATVFVLGGMGVDNRLYILDEWVYSGRESGLNKSPSQLSKDFQKWISNLGVTPEYTFIDPSAISFISQLWTDIKNPRLRNSISKANNDVKAGIELMTNLIAEDRFRVLKKCTHTLTEISTYSWDRNAQMRGEDKPSKTNDHCMDAIRYMVFSNSTMWRTILKRPIN